MLTVDNSGRGNCMYYAYSISLMYFLRAKNNQEITTSIFDKLKLKEDQKAQLNALLSKKPQQEFTTKEIKTIIEPILGKATRDLAAEHTMVEFKKDPQSTSLFSATKYGLEYYFKKAAKTSQPQLAGLIDHEFTNRDYTDAEIYRVDGMKKSMQKFAESIIPDVTKSFEEQWATKEKELVAKKGPLSEKDIEFHKGMILDNIMRAKSVDFFLANNDEHLNQYASHIKREFIWGSEETLMVLHRAIQGERMVRNTAGTIDTFYDAQICLHMHRNNRSPFFQAGTPEMILNNQGNVHWTSKVPETIFTPEAQAKQQSHSKSVHKLPKVEVGKGHALGLDQILAIDPALVLDPDLVLDSDLDLDLFLVTDSRDDDLTKGQDSEEQDTDIQTQTMAAIHAVASGTPKATEGFFAQMVKAIKALWEGVVNFVSYIGQKIGQKIGVVS